jgi:hypothetical protein
MFPLHCAVGPDGDILWGCNPERGLRRQGEVELLRQHLLLHWLDAVMGPAPQLKGKVAVSR